MRAAVGRADLARLLLAGRADEAGYLGYVPRPAEATDAPASSAPPAAAPPEVGARPPDGPMVFWRQTAAEFFAPLETAPVTPGLTPADRTPPHLDLFAAPPVPPLVPWSRLWPRLQALLSGETCGRAPDLRRAVAILARARPLHHIPRRPRRAWPHQLTIWLDRDPRLVPVWREQDAVLDALVPLCGRAGVTLEVLDRLTQAELAADAGHLARGIRAGEVVLVLSDLGGEGRARGVSSGATGGSTEGQSEPGTPRADLWRRTGRALRRQGARPLALVAGDHLSPGPWEAMAWTPRTATDPQEVERLLCAVATAGYVQPGLLRALRRLDPGLGLGAELAAWNHPAVLTADIGGLVLRPQEVIRRQAAFFAEPPPEDPDFISVFPRARDEAERTAARQRVQETIAAWRAGLPPELGHLEVLAWAAQVENAKRAKRGASEGEPLAESEPPTPLALAAARAWAKRLAGTLVGRRDPHETALRSFGRRALATLPDAVYRDPEAGPALQRVWMVAFEGHEGVVVPEGVGREALDALPPAEATLWAVRQMGDALHLVPGGPAWTEGGPPQPGSPLARLPDTRGELRVVTESRTRQKPTIPIPLPVGDRIELVTDTARVELARWAREPWATAAGRDHYGLWADLELGGVAQRLRWIPPGRFLMGSPESEAGRYSDEGPQHPVTIERGFWLADTPVTQALWQAVMGENPSHFKGLERPVERVSWQDAQRFFSQAKVAGLGLPTEAQWEYACRAGTPTATWQGDDPAVRTEIAWFDENSKGETQPVKTKPANPLGLHDMLGNVWEWCADPWRESYASTARESAASGRVVRGGAWLHGAGFVRAAFRDWNEPASRSADLGFRLALQAAEPVAAGGGGVGPGGAPGGAGPREAKPRGRRS